MSAATWLLQSVAESIQCLSRRPGRGYLDTWHRIDVWRGTVQALGETLTRSGLPTGYWVWL